MILLDTNVVSALMRERPDSATVIYVDKLERDEVWTTAVTVMEVRIGLLTMAEGQKRRALVSTFDTLLSGLLRSRIATFDHFAAEAAAKLFATRRARGRGVELPDHQIAGIAIARGASICTRNVRHFEDAGVPVLNPWA